MVQATAKVFHRSFSGPKAVAYPCRRRLFLFPTRACRESAIAIRCGRAVALPFLRFSETGRASSA